MHDIRGAGGRQCLVRSVWSADGPGSWYPFRWWLPTRATTHYRSGSGDGNPPSLPGSGSCSFVSRLVMPSEAHTYYGAPAALQLNVTVSRSSRSRAVGEGKKGKGNEDEGVRAKQNRQMANGWEIVLILVCYATCTPAACGFLVSGTTTRTAPP